MKTNLVIACWSGIRRYMYPESAADRAFYLKKQVEQLSKLNHNLTQITFVNPHYNLEPDDYTEYLNNLPSKIGTADVVVHKRPNIGMSYGGFSEVFDKYLDEFDYYFFMEDDYFFVKDNFDSIFIEEMETRGPNCGYLCMHMGNGGGVYKMHAAVPMGCIATWAALRVREKHGRIPSSGSSTDYTANEAGQVEFGFSFHELGLLEDFKDKYQCPLSFLGRVVTIYEENEEQLIVPTQVLCQSQPS